ncbi:MAG: PhoH family protein, partial [Thermicanus sp.]|nr:PhoH family protein [Thermicanus sp.]
MQVSLDSVSIRLASTSESQILFGPQDHYLKMMEEAFSVRILLRNDEVLVQGKQEQLGEVLRLLEVMMALIRRKTPITEQDVHYAISLAKEGKAEELLTLFEEEVGRTLKGKVIRAKTLGQSHYISSLKKKEIVFASGPAGTGKTYLAVVFAVSALKSGMVKRILLTRPAVEAGERLGFLPGDLQEKVDPYLRPLYDALYDMMGVEQVSRSMERGTIEIAPLAYMRGRTLEESFVILDEAQNTTPEQMRMFLTRLGWGSRMVITGDLTQVDLPKGTRSGLKDAWETLHHISEIG